MVLQHLVNHALLFESELKGLQEMLRIKVKNLKHNAVQKTLASHLYELMPEAAVAAFELMVASSAS